MNEKRDYSLLRPLDLEAAKRGEPICWADGDEARFIGTMSDGSVVVEHDDGSAVVSARMFMAPLAWIEGRPVYKGDCLYNREGENVIVKRISRETGRIISKSTPLQNCTEWTIDYLSWSRPMVKREGWVNIVAVKDSKGAGQQQRTRIVRNADIYRTEESAQRWAETCGDVIATIRIKWKEPAA